MEMDDKAKQIVGRAIQMLNSTNPYERQQAIKMIESHEAFFARKMAYGPALRLYEKETDTEVKVGLLKIIANYCQGKDRKALDIFIAEIDNPDFNIRWAAFSGLKKYKENAAIVLSKVIKMAEDSLTSSWTKRQIMGLLGAMGKKAEPAIHIITKELASKSWLMRRATRGAVKKLNKSGLNVVGHLINQLETGTVEEKLAASTGLGSLQKDAKGSVSALAVALKHEDPEVRAKAAWALWKMEKNAAPAENGLREALNDESSAVSKYALKALNKMKKLSKAEKQEIKEMEEQEKLIKKVKKQFGYPELKEPKEGEEPEESLYKNLFFMSHALPDFPWVQKAMKTIESWSGCKCWTCERDILHGMDWLEAIYDGIEESTWYILFWSENAKNSKWTNEEIREAKVRNVNSGKPKITLVNLGMSEWPTLLSRHQGSVVKSDEDLQQFLVNLKSQVEF
ncbi:MAG: HEAT repeat domain-containing protein [Candidatus Helarchaeota archaeon]|nr:HEAT repeat domain-containing protein [Candidatus Helarchaeota archaeon]